MMPKLDFISGTCLKREINVFIYSILQSLGYPRASLTLVSTDYGSRPQLKYLDGTICPQDPHTKLSSQIEFNCDPTAGKVAFQSSYILIMSKFSECSVPNYYLFLVKCHRGLQFYKAFRMNAIMNLNGQQMLYVRFILANSLIIHANYSTTKQIGRLI